MLKPIRKALEEGLGPAQFWRDFARIKGAKHNMSWDDWDAIFASAQEHLLVSEYHPERIGDLRYPSLALGITRLWKSAQIAKSQGLTTWQWNQIEGHRILMESDRERKKQEAWDAHKKALLERVAGVKSRSADL